LTSPKWRQHLVFMLPPQSKRSRWAAPHRRFQP
jgi:hypothetical protein